MTDKLTAADMVATEPAMKYSTIQEYYPKTRELMTNWPGLISVAGDRGYYPGCRMVFFFNSYGPEGLDQANKAKLAEALGIGADDTFWPGAADQANAFFKTFGNLTVVDWRIFNVNSGLALGMLITTQLDGKELQDFQEAGRRFELIIREVREEREKAEEAEALASAKEQENIAELVALGRTAKEHNLIGKNRELEEQNADLARRIKQLMRDKRGDK